MLRFLQKVRFSQQNLVATAPVHRTDDDASEKKQPNLKDPLNNQLASLRRADRIGSRLLPAPGQMGGRLRSTYCTCQSSRPAFICSMS